MKYITLLIILTIQVIDCFGQPDGYYFQNIQGTCWLADDHISDTSTLKSSKEFRLRIYPKPIDSLKFNQSIWTFNETLVISRFDFDSKSTTALLECKYVLDEQNGLLRLTIPDSDNSTLTFNYLSVATGSFISFWIDNPKMNKKKKTTANNR